MNGLRRFFRLPLTERTVDSEVADEVMFHIESRVEDLMRSGMSAGEARRRAAGEFGDERDARRELARIDRARVRQSRRTDVVDALRQEVRLVLRSLVHEPLFAIAVIMTLALGIGVNAAMFGITDRLLFRAPPGVGQPEGVKRIYFTERSAAAGITHTRASSQPDMETLRKGLRGINDIGAYFNTDAVMGSGAEAAKLRWAITSASLFTTLEATPFLGRFYSGAEDAAGSNARVIVLGYAFWKQRFGSDRTILGRQLLVGKKNYTVIGVAQPGFNGVDYEPIDMYAPLSVAGADVVGDAWNTNNVEWLRLVVRVKPGASLSAISAQATWLLHSGNDRLAKSDISVSAEPLILSRAPQTSDNTTTETARISLWLSCLSLLVLVIACANVINLLLVRASRRQREVAIRMALGVGRARLVASFVIETMTLSFAGGALGLALTRWGGAAVRKLLLPEMDWSAGAIDRRVLLYSALLAGLCAFVAAVAPALQSLRTDLTGALRTGARAGSQRSFTRNALVALQATISVVLLVVAGLFVRSQSNLRHMDKGYDADHVMTLYIDTDALGLDGAVADAFERAAAERLSHVPGVQNVAVGMTVPFWSSLWGQVTADGVDSIPQTADGGPFYNGVTPSYFQTMGTRIVAGRGFTKEDRDGAPKVAIVSATMARLLWPHQNPLGRCIHFLPDKTCRTVVGVAQNALRDGLEGDVMMYYLPLGQLKPNGFRALFIRSADPVRTMAAVRASLQGMRKDMPYSDIRLIADLMSPRTRQWRLGSVLFTAFGALALLLAALGLYSVIAYNVAQQKRELSVRVALGAGARHMLRLVMGDAARVVILGVLIGLIAAMYASKRAASLLFHVAPWDRSVYAAVVLVLLAVALIAALIPAMRALRIDPVDALKE